MFSQSIGDVSTNNINSSAELPTMLYKLKILDHLFFFTNALSLFDWCCRIDGTTFFLDLVMVISSWMSRDRLWKRSGWVQRNRPNAAITWKCLNRKSIWWKADPYCFIVVSYLLMYLAIRKKLDHILRPLSNQVLISYGFRCCFISYSFGLVPWLGWSNDAIEKPSHFNFGKGIFLIGNSIWSHDKRKMVDGSK